MVTSLMRSFFMLFTFSLFAGETNNFDDNWSIDSIFDIEMHDLGLPPSKSSLGNKRTRRESKEPPAKRKKTDSEIEIENLIKKEFENYENFLLSLLDISYKDMSFLEYTRSIKPIKNRDWCLISTCLFLIQLGVPHEIILSFLEKIRKPIGKIHIGKKGLAKLSNAFDELPKNNEYHFTSEFAMLMRTQFLPLLKQHLDCHKIALIEKKLQFLEARKRDKKFDFVDNKCIADPAKKESVLGMINEEFNHMKDWVLSNVPDEASQVAFLSVVANDELFHALLMQNKTLKISPLCAAISIYFIKLGISSKNIMDFFLASRNKKGDIFTPGAADNFYRDFTRLSESLTPDSIHELKYAKGVIPVVFRSIFAETLLELEPLLQDLSNDPYIHFENQEILKALRKRFSAKIEKEAYFHISDEKYKELAGRLRGKKILSFVENQKLTQSQKAALLSIANNKKLSNNFAEMPTHLWMQPLARALCIYLGHFSIPSSVVHSFFHELRSEIHNFHKTSAGNIFSKYQEWDGKGSADIFNYKFVEIMKGDLSSLLKKTVGQNAQFLHQDKLSEWSKNVCIEEPEHITGHEEEVETVLSWPTFFVAHGSHYGFYADAAEAINKDLTEWIAMNIVNEAHRITFFALLTAKFNDTYFDNYVRSLPRLQATNLAIQAGVIFLSHFGIGAADIQSFMVQLRANRSVAHRAISIDAIMNMINCFFGTTKNSLIMQKNITPILSTTMRPILGHLVNKNCANFIFIRRTNSN